MFCTPAIVLSSIGRDFPIMGEIIKVGDYLVVRRIFDAPRYIPLPEWVEVS